MRALVILALLGCVSAAPFLQFTPEVVAERARFQQLFNAAAAAAAAAPDPVPAHQARPVAPQPAATFTTTWTGPVAATIPAGVPGSAPQVADTADVTAARDAFLAAYRAQVAATTGQQIAAAPRFAAPQPAVQHTTKWTGPVAATIPAGLPGAGNQVADTADVAAARAAFLAAYNDAVRATQPAAARPQAPVTFNHFNTIQETPVKAAPAPAPQPRWMGPVAATVPAGLPGSVAQVPATAEVNAAINAFNQAYSAAVAATTGRRF